MNLPDMHDVEGFIRSSNGVLTIYKSLASLFPKGQLTKEEIAEEYPDLVSYMAKTHESSIDAELDRLVCKGDLSAVRAYGTE